MPRVDAGEKAGIGVGINLDLGFPRGFRDAFEEGEQVGKGGFGVVKKVVKRATKQVLACKVLTKRLAAPDVAAVQQLRHLDTIKREVAVLKTLRGTLNVVHLDSVYEDDAHVYIVMEFCEGGEIWHRIGLRPYSEETVRGRAGLRSRDWQRVWVECCWLGYIVLLWEDVVKDGGSSCGGFWCWGFAGR